MKLYIKCNATEDPEMDSYMNNQMDNYYAFCRQFDRLLDVPTTESDLVKLAHTYDIDLADFCDANDLGYQTTWLGALAEYQRQIDAGERR